jgi:hypothetical protein
MASFIFSHITDGLCSLPLLFVLNLGSASPLYRARPSATRVHATTSGSLSCPVRFHAFGYLGRLNIIGEISDIEGYEHEQGHR